MLYRAAINLYSTEIFPGEWQVRGCERNVAEFALGMSFAGSNHEFVRLIELQHILHHFNVIADKAPIAF